MTNNILPKLIGNFKNYILIGFVAIFATSCYSVTTSSYSDREFKEKKYNKICIYSYDENLVFRSILEKTIRYTNTANATADRLNPKSMYFFVLIISVLESVDQNTQNYANQSIWDWIEYLQIDAKISLWSI